jgi:hypothetical protein
VWRDVSANGGLRLGSCSASGSHQSPTLALPIESSCKRVAIGSIRLNQTLKRFLSSDEAPNVPTLISRAEVRGARVAPMLIYRQKYHQATSNRHWR